MSFWLRLLALLGMAYAARAVVIEIKSIEPRGEETAYIAGCLMLGQGTPQEEWMRPRCLFDYNNWVREGRPDYLRLEPEAGSEPN